jgi:hypothetical protein
MCWNEIGSLKENLMSPKIVLLALGLFIGALTGYFTRPEAAEIKVGPLSVEVQGQAPARTVGPLTQGQMRHIGIFGLVGAVLGFGMGFAVDRKSKLG